MFWYHHLRKHPYHGQPNFVANQIRQPGAPICKTVLLPATPLAASTASSPLAIGRHVLDEIASWELGKSQEGPTPPFSPSLGGCFRYPQIIHFNRDFHYKPSILGYHYSWKHPGGGFSPTPWVKNMRKVKIGSWNPNKSGLKIPKIFELPPPRYLKIERKRSGIQKMKFKIQFQAKNYSTS